MSWSISTDVPAGDTHDALLAALEETDDRPAQEVVVRAALTLLDLVGDPAIDPGVIVELTGDDDSVTITVTRVEGEAKEPNPNDAGTVGDEGIEVTLDEAQERAESFDDTKMHAQYEATGSLLPDEEHAKVEVFDPPIDDAALSAEAPFDPGEFKASEITDEELDAYSTFQLNEIRQAEESGKARKSVLDQINAAIQRKGSV